MFQLYLLLRLKNFGRIVIELGIFRIVFLTILTVAAIMILFLAENRFAIPVVCVLLLAGYHNVRKDKEFLRTLTPVSKYHEGVCYEAKKTCPFSSRRRFVRCMSARFLREIGLRWQ